MRLRGSLLLCDCRKKILVLDKDLLFCPETAEFHKKVWFSVGFEGETLDNPNKRVYTCGSITMGKESSE
jgi:hypothetical protein